VQTIYGGTTEIMKEIIGRAWASSPEGSANVLQGVNKVLVEVSDQERAKRFWVERIGCEVAQDEAYGDERWLEVRLPDGVVLVLAQREGRSGSRRSGCRTRRSSSTATTWTPPGASWSNEG
jgi:hypothetical protein